MHVLSSNRTDLIPASDAAPLTEAVLTRHSVEVVLLKIHNISYLVGNSGNLSYRPNTLTVVIPVVRAIARFCPVVPTSSHMSRTEPA